MLLGALVAPAAVSALDSQARRVWHEGPRRHVIWQADDEFAVILRAPDSVDADDLTAAARAVVPGAALEEQRGRVARFRTAPGEASDAGLRSLGQQPGVRLVTPVFYTRPGRTGSRLLLSGQIIVTFRTAPTAAALAAFTGRYGLTLVRVLDVVPHTFMFEVPSGVDSLDRANAIYASGDVAAAYPNWIRTIVPR